LQIKQHQAQTKKQTKTFALLFPFPAKIKPRINNYLDLSITGYGR